MRNPLILILAALGTGALASIYREQRQQIEALKSEATETTRIAQQLQQQMFDERQRADAAEDRLKGLTRHPQREQ